MPLRQVNRSITFAIIITIVAAFLFTFLFLYLGINHRKEVYNDSKVLATEISRKAAFETEAYFNSAILYAKSLGKQATLLRDLNGSRQEIKHFLKSVITENNHYLGTWTLWEPDAFDGKDYLYKNDTLFNDIGSIGMGYFRSQGKIKYEVMTPADYIGDYFKYPKQYKTTYLTEPYRFVYSGHKEVFFGTTVSQPILGGDKFLGTIGIDIDLANLQKELNKVHPYGSGYLSLISHKGIIITHNDTSFINRNIFDILSESDKLSYEAIQKGKEITFEIQSEFTGNKSFRMFYPIFIGETNKPWSMMIEIPLKEATARSKKLLYVAIITLAVGLLLLSYLLYNISDRKKFEKALIVAKNKAEESDRLKTAFLNNISHEIRTPLNGILGFSELLVTSDESIEVQKKYKEIIGKSCDQLLSVMSDVIELSKIQTHSVQLKIKPVMLEAIFGRIKQMYEPVAKEKGIEFRLSESLFSSELVIDTDDDKLYKIFMYLLNNAFKFTPKGFVECGYNNDEQNYRFFVKDSGIGIKPESKKHIFNYFSQGENSSARKYDGLGVGLSLTKSFVDLLGGTIHFESEVNEGTTFYITLPKKNSKQ